MCICVVFWTLVGSSWPCWRPVCLGWIVTPINNYFFGQRLCMVIWLTSFSFLYGMVHVYWEASKPWKSHSNRYCKLKGIYPACEADRFGSGVGVGQVLVRRHCNRLHLYPWTSCLHFSSKSYKTPVFAGLIESEHFMRSITCFRINSR